VIAAAHRASPELLAWLRSLQGDVQQVFRLGGWPTPEDIDVGFDSAHRVQTGGGFNYFK
jgi:hypothetical protein